MRRIVLLLIFTFLFLTIQSPLLAYQALFTESEGMNFSGDFSVTFRELDKHNHINTNVRGDDPFNMIRLRTFITRQWTEDISALIEILYDSGADVRVNAGYLRFNHIAGPLNMKVGILASAFNNFGYRSTYYNQNPVIGVPLMWGYKTPVQRNGSSTNSNLMSDRSEVNRGAPAAYDGCWDTGIEFFGEKGMVEFAYAITLAAQSNPRAYDNDGYQQVIRLGLKPMMGLKFGVSGAFAPWLNPDDSVTPTIDDLEKYQQTSTGAYLEYQAGHWQFFSEFINVELETPFVYEGSVDFHAGYLEGRWNFDPQWYLGGRFGILQYGKIAVNDNGTGTQEPWGYDMSRAEVAIGYKVIRTGTIRLDYQTNMYDNSAAEEIDIIALQWHFRF